ncbi:dickkopf-related protein 3-like [Stegostoma tigrinum]|uniref:dickkopf-related protein 3-like n=1 Tax=Stegostoma tigrinum TaxID=3053191 RepID=UPI0028707600|nr:dickkopf-related protein 3-like [Stegostoma tigrinum]
MSNSITFQVLCEHDHGCGVGFFCDKHFRRCAPLRDEGQFCRRDSQCSQGLSCMFGQCHFTVPKGHEGARCKHDEDCSVSMCCARHHGEMICKKKLTAGTDCYIPDGGLAYSINQLCPCEEGLFCRNNRIMRDRFVCLRLQPDARPSFQCLQIQTEGHVAIQVNQPGVFSTHFKNSLKNGTIPCLFLQLLIDESFP